MVLIATCAVLSSQKGSAVVAKWHARPKSKVVRPAWPCGAHPKPRVAHLGRCVEILQGVRSIFVLAISRSLYVSSRNQRSVTHSEAGVKRQVANPWARVILWMDRILHQVESMGNQISCGYLRGIILPVGGDLNADLF